VPTAARVPRTVAARAEVAAMTTELPKALQSSPEPMKSFSYQISEKPVQLPLFEELKEYTRRTARGMKRKTITAP
jgi:hypothetical protein